MVRVINPFEKGAYDIEKTGRIRYNGLVDLGDFFRGVREWFLMHKYTFVEKTLKHKFGSAGLEKEMVWMANKKVYDYLHYKLEVKFKIKDIVDVEVIRDGNKEKLQQCRIFMDVSGTLNYDPFKRFGTGLLGKNLQAIYHKYFVKKDILYKWDDYCLFLKLLQIKVRSYLSANIFYISFDISFPVFMHALKKELVH